MQDISIKDAREMISHAKPDALTLLDVRQDWEYEQGHMPGALLIPLSELPGRLAEVPDGPVLVYCRSGGRSRSGAMLLDGNGRDQVFSMVGGLMGWDGHVAIGPIESGLDSMLSARSERDALLTAYGMEVFLRQFYQRLETSASDPDAKAMYEKLAGFEDGHMNSLYQRYTRTESEPLSREDFDATVQLICAEGGVDPDEFLQTHGGMMNTVVDIISMAMMFEAQALDYYQRAARAFSEGQLVETMMGLAREEQAHLKVLASFMDKQG